MIDRLQPSPFSTPDAVTVWDTWFRWRENGRLRDLSVEATWERVARALSAAEATGARRWATRLFDAQSRWQLIFDERILAHAGTPEAEFAADPVAVLNAAMFVRSPLTPAACFDVASFRETAALAVRALDNALSLRASRSPGLPDLRVGLTGVADALFLLGKRYDGAAGRVMAEAIGRALAEGCLQGSVRLAAERGAAASSGAVESLPVRNRDLPEELLADAARFGARHRRLSEISSQPRLARFANNVADALEPLDARAGPDHRQVGPPSYALALARAAQAADPSAARGEPGKVSLLAQLALRGAVQPWIDAPIDYAFRVEEGVEPTPRSFLRRLADAYNLGAMTVLAN